jgi:hypothetical protein
MKKHFLPESFDFGMPSVELIGVGTKGLDKTAMVKRASAFDDVIGDLKKKPNREYLHVITTGAFEKYGANANCFIGETPVLTTLTGKRKKIKDIKEGDLVLTGKGRLRPVTKVYVRKYAGEIIEVWGTEWKSKVSMTAEHPVQVVNPGNRETLDGKFVKACTLTINDELVVPAMDHVKSGNKEFHDKVALVRSRNAKCSTVFNLEVEEDHTYCIPFVVHNCDGWNGESFDLEFPHPEDQKKKKITLDGGLSKYHDDTYMKNGAVYQEHKTKRAGVDPSGEVVAARYNPIMKRGELIISVDTGKWASRLQKKAQGKDIYLSIGADVPHDICNICGRIAKTASQHCDHFKKHRGQVYDSGVRACVMNDSPSFYDISGVDVPADQIAFVLSKVASGSTAKEAALEVLSVCTPRRPMLYTKAAAILDKLSKMEKQLVGMVEGDKQEPAFHDDDEVAKDFILKVENFPSDEIIDSCNRKGILLSPGMLFKIMGKDCTEDSDKEMLCGLDDDCCGDCSTMFEDMEEDECCNEELLDGSFDEHLPADLSLDAILEKFVPEFGVTQPAMQGKIITVTITGRKGKEPKQESKEASLNKQAQEALRRTYARYVISFAERNDDATCYNALRKIAVYGK